MQYNNRKNLNNVKKQQKQFPQVHGYHAQLYSQQQVPQQQYLQQLPPAPQQQYAQQFQLPQQQYIQQMPMQSAIYQYSNSKIFNDDEPIKEQSKTLVQLTDEQKQQLKQISNKIHLSIQSQYTKIQKYPQSQTMAGMITVKADELCDISNQNLNESRPGIDIIFLLDKSGSMSGSKIELLKSTLLYVLNLLNENDRISLVEFNGFANRINPLQRMTKSNKMKITNQIKAIRAGGGTDFYHPFDFALNMIKNRKYKNQLTSIFMLSDGQASKNYESLFSSSLIEDQYTIQTFGIGADHDPELMRDMAQLKQGNFYYIENMKIVDECFVDALGGIISIIAKNIKIKLRFQELQNKQKASIKDAYSIFWKKNDSNEYEVQLNNLISGCSKDFVFLLDIPPLSIHDLEQIKIMEATMEFTNIDETETFNKSAQLSLDLTENSNLNPYLNKDVFINFQRIQVAELMKKAGDLAGKGENFQAQKELQKKMDELKAIQFTKDNQIIQGLIKDLQEAHKRCEKSNFAHDGNIWLKQRNYMHLQQQGADFSMPQQQNIYSNCVQKSMQMKCKARKS